MNFLTSNYYFTPKSCNLPLLSTSQYSGQICYGTSTKLFCVVLNTRFSYSSKGCRGYASASASKKSRKRGNFQKRNEKLVSIPDPIDVEDGNNNTLEVQTKVSVPTRDVVLQACSVTSALIGALGVLIRQVSHIAAREGLPVADCSADITFSLESWHFGLIMGSVILVSSSRLVLLKIWPDFAESSEAANQQVLTCLEPLDYLIVSFLPGISEELLFRGSLLPLCGINLTSIFAVAVLFGVLHLGSGRNYSFAIWATLVGVVYGYETALSSSMTVPMATHAVNNLIGGIIWRYSSKQTG